YYATRYMPLADVMTFYMATPLIVTALSAPLLGEKVERFRWIGVLIGFFGGGLIGAATIPWGWTTPTLFDLGLMFLVGVVSMTCFIFIVRALALARAAVLAPLQYSAILWAAIMGWLVWRDAPTLPIIVGNAIIIGSGLFVATRRETGPIPD